MALKIYDMSWMIHHGGKTHAHKDYTFQGYPLGGVKFFVSNMVLDLLANHNIACCFDSKTNKSSLLGSYKSSRPREQYIISQCMFAYSMLMKCNVSCLKEEGFEGDDLLFTVVNRFRNDFREIVCVSNDHDIAHNVYNNVRVEAAGKGGMDISPSNFITSVQRGDAVEFNTISAYKVLIGDSSDEIPAFVSSDGRRGRNIYKEYVLWGQANLPDGPERPYLFSQQKIFEYFLDTLNLPEKSREDLNNRIQVVFPKEVVLGNIELTKAEDISRDNLIKMLSILGDNISLQRIGAQRVRLSDDDISFFRNSAQGLRDGTFAVDHDLPIHRFSDESVPVTMLRAFE